MIATDLQSVTCRDVTLINLLSSSDETEHIYVVEVSWTVSYCPT